MRGVHHSLNFLTTFLKFRLNFKFQIKFQLNFKSHDHEFTNITKNIQIFQILKFENSIFYELQRKISLKTSKESLSWLTTFQIVKDPSGNTLENTITNSWCISWHYELGQSYHMLQLSIVHHSPALNSSGFSPLSCLCMYIWLIYKHVQ